MMPNALTGDFEAVIRVSEKVINKLLALFHGNGIDSALSPSFPHLLRMRIGGSRVPQEYAYITPWLARLDIDQRARISKTSVASYANKMPVGVGEKLIRDYDLLNTHLKKWRKSGQLKGLADIQCGAPTVAIEADGNAVVVRVRIRARYRADTGSHALPEWINGAIKARYLLQLGGVGLAIVAGTNDDDYDFEPAGSSNLSATDLAKIKATIGQSLREDFAPMEIALPGSFPVTRLKLQEGGNHGVIAVPFNLDGTASSGNLATLPRVQSASDLTLAFGRQYLDQMFQPVLQSIKESVKAIRIPVDAFLFSTVYRGSMKSGPTLTWHDGSITLSGAIDLKTDSILPNQTMSFSQRFVLVLNTPAQTFDLRSDGEPTIQASGGYEDRARTEFKKIRDKSIGQIGSSITTRLRDGLDRFVAALRSFDHTASGRFTTLTLSPQGILVGCKIGLGSPPDPVVAYQEDADRRSFDAMRSWVPGGFIDFFTWTWNSGLSGIFAPATHDYVEKTDRWTVTRAETTESGTSPPPGVVKEICLSINDAAGRTCGDGRRPEFPRLIPWDWDLFTVEKARWSVGQIEGPIDEVILAHGVWGFAPSTDGRFGTNQIVHFSDAGRTEEIETLRSALNQISMTDTPASLMIVFPQGTFCKLSPDQLAFGLGAGNSNPESMRVLSAPAPTPSEPDIEITEDFGAKWTSAFRMDRKAGPNTFLMNPKGEVVWSGSVGANTGKFGAILKQNLVATSGPSVRRDQLRVEAGKLVPFMRFSDALGRQIELKRLLGHPYRIIFWQPWSKPSVKELAHMTSLAEAEEARLLIAVSCEGGKRQTSDKQVGPVIHVDDVDKRLQRTLGIRVWPTTLSVNAHGIVDYIQKGMTLPTAGKRRARSTS